MSVAQLFRDGARVDPDGWVDDESWLSAASAIVPGRDAVGAELTN